MGAEEERCRTPSTLRNTGIVTWAGPSLANFGVAGFANRVHGELPNERLISDGAFVREAVALEVALGTQRVGIRAELEGRGLQPSSNDILPFRQRRMLPA